MENPIKSVNRQLQEAQQKNQALTAQLEQSNAILAYVAMMADVEIPLEEEQEAADNA